VIKKIIFICSIPLLFACSEPEEQIPTYTVSEGNLSIVVPAKGELEAASSQVISVPGRQTMTIAWLEQEFKRVKEGELIAVFDGEQISLNSRKEELAMMLIERDIQQKHSEKSKQEFEVLSEKQLVGKEFDFAQSFNIDDLRIYSQLEIIDSMQNTEFLGAKDTFLDWKKQSVTKQNQSAVDVLDIRLKGHQAKLKNHQDALVKLEVRAPYDGLLVYEKNWRGEKPSVGSSIFPGNPIAKLPNLNKMQAKVFVLDKEAIGLEKGQNVKLSLDAYPDQTIKGVVKDVAAFSRTISRANPTKYFELTVELEQESHPDYLPGRKLSAKVIVDEKPNTLVVPLQVIDNEDGRNFVYLKSGDRFIRQPVDTGAKNLYFVEIIEGLKAGDVIALSDPKEQLNG
jgi:multidrug efflux pump subunit AcrA (membrane-fusion protein)